MPAVYLCGGEHGIPGINARKELRGRERHSCPLPLSAPPLSNDERGTKKGVLTTPCLDRTCDRLDAPRMERHGPVHAALCGRLLGGHELLSSATVQTRGRQSVDFSSGAAQGQKAAGRRARQIRSDRTSTGGLRSVEVELRATATFVVLAERATSHGGHTHTQRVRADRPRSLCHRRHHVQLRREGATGLARPRVRRP